MKTRSFLLFFVTILLMAAALSALSASAAAPVLFVSDEGAGARTGRDAANALGVVIETREPKSNPKNHKNSILYQATERLKETGGTVVICGPVRIDVSKATGTGSSTKDSQMDTHDQTITFTSVYDGVDYRQTNQAAITLDKIAHLICGGDTVWENITFITEGTGRYLCAGYYKMTIGSGATSRPADPADEERPNCYLSLAGGERYRRAAKDSELIIADGAGTFGHVAGANVGIGGKYDHVGTTRITIAGGTFLGNVFGTSAEEKTPTTGRASLTITGGTFRGGIYGAGNGGFLNEDASANISITGGDFSQCTEVASICDGYANQPPASSRLDLSRCDSETAAVLESLQSGFTEIKLPVAYVKAPPEETTPPSTADVVPNAPPSVGLAETLRASLSADGYLLPAIHILLGFVFLSLVMIAIGIVQKLRAPKS